METRTPSFCAWGVIMLRGWFFNPTNVFNCESVSVIVGGSEGGGAQAGALSKARICTLHPTWNLHGSLPLSRPTHLSHLCFLTWKKGAMTNNLKLYPNHEFEMSMGSSVTVGHNMGTKGELSLSPSRHDHVLPGP